MAKRLGGLEVSKALNEKILVQVADLKEKGIIPMLAIVRVGEREDDIAYERGAMKRCDGLGIQVKNILLPGDVSEEKLIETIQKVNQDDKIHGMLLFQPLPKHINSERVRGSIMPEKDMDGVTDGSLAGVFTGSNKGYPPCTAAASIEILNYYQVPLSGKKVVVIGRSLVIGKPVAMMLLEKHATVTICHSRTTDMRAYCKDADIIVVAVGRAKMVDDTFVKQGQIIVDVGINVNEEGKLCGDVLYDKVEPIVEAITPVPGGVGSVTTSILAMHVVEAAAKCYHS